MSLNGWDSNNKLILTIDNSKIDSDLINFPVNITLSSGTGQTGFDATAVFDELTTSGTDSYTKLLLHMDGDQSSFTHTITSYGTPKIYPPTTFSGFNSLGYVEFDGSTEYISLADSSAWDLTSIFTIDFWFKTNTNNQCCIINTGNANNANEFQIELNRTAGKLSVYSAGQKCITTNSWNDGAWHHCALVGDGTDLKMYIDGVKDGEQIGYAPAWTPTGMYIGATYVATENYDGILSEFRISKGIARWTSNFIPPTETYESDSYISLLLHFEGDKSNTGHIITFNGGLQMNSTTTKWDGSYYLDGIDDFLLIQDHDDFYLSGDFTMDWWIMYNSFSATYNTVYSQTAPGWFQIFFRKDQLKIFITSNVWTEPDNLIEAAWNPSLSTWYHVAITRSGNDFRWFVDGTQIGSTITKAGAINNHTNNIRIGWDGADDRQTNAWIEEFRVSKGIARWVSNFAPPEGPYGSSWSNRKKIAITDSSDNQLYVEIERWNWTTEEANLWVRVPTVSSGTDTTLYFYYDSTQSDNTTYIGDIGNTPAQNVWDSNFIVVWHMSQDPSGGSDAIKDSTSYLNHGTPAGSMTTADLVDGKIGKAIDFDGSDDDVQSKNTLGITGTAQRTSEVIIKANSTSQMTYAGYCEFGTLSAETGKSWQLTQYLDSGHWGWSTFGGGNDYDSGVAIDLDWHNISLIYTGTKAEIFIDGDSKNSHTYSIDTIDSDLFVGGGYYSNRFWNAKIGDVRISNINRSPAWIKATYHSNWNDLVTFGAAGGEGVTFIFSNPIPTDLSTVYGTTQQLYLTTTVTGSAPSYIYDATFYDAYDDGVISPIASGIQSGQPVGVIMNTISGINYSWYCYVTSSGYNDTSDTYTFTNRFMCSGQTQINNVPASGVPVRLYRRNTGEYIGGVISSGVSGTFEIETDYNEYHYAIALYTSDDTNSIIADWLSPNN